MNSNKYSSQAKQNLICFCFAFRYFSGKFMSGNVNVTSAYRNKNSIVYFFFFIFLPRVNIVVTQIVI